MGRKYLTKRRPMTKGWIYAFTVGSLTKIGCSRDPARRVLGQRSRLQKQAGVVSRGHLQAMYVNNNMFQVEWQIHCRLGEYQVQTERYHLPPEILANFPQIVEDACARLEDIRREDDSVFGRTELARRYNICHSTLSKILNGGTA